MKLPTFLTTVTPLSKALAMLLFVSLPFIGFVSGIKYCSSVTINESIYTPPKITKTNDSSSIRLEIEDNRLVIFDNNMIRPVTKINQEFISIKDNTGKYNQGTNYRLYLTRETSSSDTQPYCENNVYLQKENEKLVKVVSGGCEFTYIADFAFPSNTLNFFYVMRGGDGSAIQLFDIQGKEITIRDDQKLLDGWVKGSIDQVGWSKEYNANISKLHLWKELGAKNAEIVINVDNMTVIPNTFTLVNME